MADILDLLYRGFRTAYQALRLVHFSAFGVDTSLFDILGGLAVVGLAITILIPFTKGDDHKK